MSGFELIEGVSGAPPPVTGSDNNPVRIAGIGLCQSLRHLQSNSFKLNEIFFSFKLFHCKNSKPTQCYLENQMSLFLRNGKKISKWRNSSNKGDGQQIEHKKRKN